MRQRREDVFAFSTPALITYCAPGPEIQSADIRKRLITCGGPHASPGFIYTHPVNSAASEPRLSPDHYLTIHSAVSQSYLKEWPLLNLWLCSSSAVKSQTPAERRRLSSCVHGCGPTTNLLHKCSFRASEKSSNKGDQRGTKCLYSERRYLKNDSRRDKFTTTIRGNTFQFFKSESKSFWKKGNTWNTLTHTNILYTSTPPNLFMCWPQVVEDRKGFFDRFKLRINIFMLWWCFYIFLLRQTQITQNSASSLIQLFHLTVYFLQLIHKSPGLLSLFWVVWIKNIICFFFVAITREEKDRNAETLGRQTGFRT